jgi:hypothetical protein
MVASKVVYAFFLTERETYWHFNFEVGSWHPVLNGGLRVGGLGVRKVNTVSFEA